jgi:hypothetical protein
MNWLDGLKCFCGPLLIKPFAYGFLFSLKLLVCAALPLIVPNIFAFSRFASRILVLGRYLPFWFRLALAVGKALALVLP